MESDLLALFEIIRRDLNVLPVVFFCVASFAVLSLPAFFVAGFITGIFWRFSLVWLTECVS